MVTPHVSLVSSHTRQIHMMLSVVYSQYGGTQAGQPVLISELTT